MLPPTMRVLLNEGNRDLIDRVLSANTKRIIVDRSEQTLYAYEGDELLWRADFNGY